MMKSIVILLAVAVCYSKAVESKTEAVRPKGVALRYEIRSSDPERFFPLNKVLNSRKQFVFVTEANPIEFYLTRYNDSSVPMTLYNCYKIEISPGNDEEAVIEYSYQGIHVRPTKNAFSTNKWNEVTVTTDIIETESVQEALVIGVLEVRVNDVVAFSFDLTEHRSINMQDFQYISFVATNYRKKTEVYGFYSHET